ncbi:MAG: DUF445 domain-containing protein, partial [Clostridiales bacterium]|nr:DUF445 domain-containing protein [Clostridiales bacterium]
IDSFIESAEKSGETVGGYLEILFKGNKDAYLETASGYLLNSLENTLNGGEFKKALGSLISNSLNNFIKNQEAGRFSGLILDNSQKYLAGFQESYINNDGFRLFLYNSIDKILAGVIEKDYLLKDLVSEKKASQIKYFLFNNSDKLAEIINNFLINNPDIEFKIKSLIEKILDDNFGKFISIFISENKIYYNMKEGVISYLASEENKDALSGQIDKIVDTILGKKLNSFIEKIDQETVSNIKSAVIINLTSGNLNFPDSLLNFVEQKLKEYEGLSIYDVLLKINPDYDIISLNYISNFIGFLSKEIIKMARGNYSRYLEKVLDINVSLLLSKLDKQTIKNIKAQLMRLVDYVLGKGILYVSENMDIRKIVEGRINSFEMKEAESIIISVVDKELQAITVLGGVLGFIIALIPALLG